MAKIKKIQENGTTVYPVTISKAVKNIRTGKTLDEIILGDGQATSEKFSFRSTGGPNKNVHDGSARIEVLKGSSVVWNQQWASNKSTINKTGLTITINNGVYTIVGDGTSTEATLTSTAVGRLTPNNKHALIGIPNSATLTSAYIVSGDNGSKYAQNTIITVSNHGFFYIRVEAGFNGEMIFSPKLINLTQMFGAGNEPTTIEQFYEMLPEVEDINAYNTGKIVDANYKAIKTTGFNQWDEQWEFGYYDNSTGLPVDSNLIIRSKNYNRILPNTKYFCKSPDYIGYNARILFYTKTKEFIKSASFYNTEITTPSDAYYFHLKFGSFQNNVTTYNHDVCINIAWDEYSALNGQYKPYKPFERDLSWVANYFPNGMRSAGNVADEIRFNSTTQQWEAVQRVGVVDLGSLTWNYVATRKYFLAYLEGMYIPSYYFHKGFLCSKYEQVDFNEIYREGDTSAPCFGVPANHNQICVSDATYTDASTFKSAMAGVMLNYELAEPIVTPITEDVNLAYDVADYGTEQLIVAEGAQSAPLSAEVVYDYDSISTKLYYLEKKLEVVNQQIPEILRRLNTLENILTTKE